MPRIVILNFILIAICLFLYSISIILIKPSNWKIFLKILAVSNILYCLLTIFQIFQNKSSLTLFGYLYFVVEVIVILILSYSELKYCYKRSS